MSGRIQREARIVIIGAGPTGLGAALRLKELGHHNFHVYESAGQVGGLATSFKDEQGFTWDIGGHVQFSHYRYFDDLMDRALPQGWLHHERESWIWIEERFVPYPFQYNIRHLAPGTRWKCLQGLIQLSKHPSDSRPADFRQWIDTTFGQGIAEIFMVPYNLKVWACPLESMDFNWIGERVAVMDLERVLCNLVHEKDDACWGPNRTFRFPKVGGTGAVWEGVADLVGREHISLRKEAVAVDPAAKTIALGDGSQDHYDVLISTMPVNCLVQIAGLRRLQEPASRLCWSSSNIVGIGLSGKPPSTLSQKCWMYFPENNCPFYRVTVFSNYSPNNVPDINTQWSLMAEISESPHKPVKRDRLIEDVIGGMLATKLIGRSHDILSTWSYHAPYGLPTPTLGRDQALNRIHAELEPYQIYSRGRFGGWKYEVSNQDHSLIQGVELANRLVASSVKPGRPSC